MQHTVNKQYWVVAGRLKVTTVILAFFITSCSCLIRADEPKPLCALFVFENQDKTPTFDYLASVIEAGLRREFLRVDKWRLVERARIDKLLEEQDLKSAGIVTGRAGTILGANYFVLGEYMDQGGIVGVDARVVRTRDGRIVAFAGWSGHISGLWDEMPAKLASALLGVEYKDRQIPEHVFDLMDKASRKLDQGQIEDAMRICDEVLAEHPSFVSALLLRGYAELEKKGMIRYAIKDFQKVLDIDEDNLSCRLGLARAWLREDKPDAKKIVTILDEVLKHNPGNGEACFLKALCYEKLNRLDEALNEAQKATDAVPGFSAAWQVQARALLATKGAKDAVSAAVRATECDPLEAQAWMLLGDIQFATGDVLAAKESFKKGLACNPSLEIQDLLNKRLEKQE